MKTQLTVLLVVAMMAPGAFAIGDIAIGPYFGIAMPLANDDAKSGALYGLQARVSLIPGLSIGGHYQSRGYGNPSQTFFEGTPQEFTDEKDGGNVTSIGLDAYLGKTGGAPGMNFYFLGSYGTYKWKRDNLDDVSKTAFAIGPGIELVLPMKVGIEGRAMLEIAMTGESGSWKSFLWFVGLNYHIGLGPM